MNQEPMEPLHLGAPWPSPSWWWVDPDADYREVWDGFGWCASPVFFVRGEHRFRAPDAPAHDDEIVLTDGTTTKRVVATDLLAERSVTLVTPADGRLRPGEPVVLAWSHPGDTRDSQLFSVQVAYRTVPDRAETRFHLYRNEDFEWDGHLLSFVLPEHAAPGPARLMVSVFRYSVPIVACEGFVFYNVLTNKIIEEACSVLGSMINWPIDVETLEP